MTLAAGWHRVLLDFGAVGPLESIYRMMSPLKQAAVKDPSAQVSARSIRHYSPPP